MLLAMGVPSSARVPDSGAEPIFAGMYVCSRGSNRGRGAVSGVQQSKAAEEFGVPVLVLLGVPSSARVPDSAGRTNISKGGKCAGEGSNRGL
jgi:hypothetical protein